MSELKEAARRVQAAADALGLAITVRRMPQSTRTAQEAADACETSVAQIVKSLVFRGAASGMPYLLLVSGANRVDEARAAETVGEPLARPDARYVRELTGYAIGGIPPFGHKTPLTTFIDADLLAHAVVWAAAGTPDCLFFVAPHALAAATGATILPVGRA